MARSMNDAGIGDGRRCGRNRRGAFTLVELLVVIAIIALLISILLPSLFSAREQAKAVVCGSQLRSMGTGVIAYTAVSRDWLPGHNTSGVAMRTQKFNVNSNPDIIQKNNLPVQSYDWIMPILRMESPNLPAKRVDRFKLIQNHFKCVSQDSIESVIYGNATDKADFEAVKDWAALSYLQPVHFQMWGQNNKNRVLADTVGVPALKVKSEAANPDWEVVTEEYLSQIHRVGPAGEKVMAADGTRYLDSNGILDHDISSFPGTFGAFTSSGAWWAGSTAYGVDPQSLNWAEKQVSAGSPSKGKNLALSYRHKKRNYGASDAHDNTGALNVLFFDGHVTLLGDKDSRKVDLWYPTGSMVQHPNEGMTFAENKQIIR